MAALTHARISDLLAMVAKRPGKVSVSTLLDVFGDRAFGAVMFVLAAPLVLPMPPGVSTLLGAPLVFITGQWAIGRRRLWLPKVLADRTMSKTEFRTLSGKLAPYLERLERRLRPRLTFMYGPVADRLIGAMCLILALIVFLPIPFGNMLPSFAIAAFAIGAAERDGVAALVGWVAGILSFVVLALLGRAILAAMMAFISVLFGLGG